MKSRTVALISLTVAVTTVTWSAIAFSAEPSTVKKTDTAALMDSKKAEILKRVGMSAPMEQPEAGEEDFVAEAQKNGLIIEVSLEEVEAALKAAAATPSHEDDIVAMRLMQWGSYRFYLDEKTSAEEFATSR